MLCPTIKNISEIIEKLKELQITIANIEDMPLEFPEYKKTDDKSLTVEQLISLAAGHGHGLSDDKFAKMVESSPETLNLLIVPQAVSSRIVEKLPTLPMDTLKKLLEDDIPRLLCDDTVPKVKKQVLHNESFFTKEGQSLHFIQEAIKRQIEKNIEEAKVSRWQKHVRPLIDKIERLLFPFWDYIKEYSSYGCYANVVIMEIIRNGLLSSLPEVIREFERIKYKMEVESKQRVPEEPSEIDDRKGKFGFHKK